ncbi:ADP-ribose pyrophosphatase [Leptospira perolatii]|uniref:ADP-ribose pyrophosphatase n=1 Tax=Leptospira perolatii TaxID=2023191 RepID=A0A2M9ZLY3_9LEPT|nr:NUDIX hydrolase [Leptospira perolatii]PJZ69791.1 ADP-ribose pyrophosphatase [Leptospira perolatii]PJZ72994.1 ADP-ribose pyrophosphatase [Leptospira perolatii]
MKYCSDCGAEVSFIVPAGDTLPRFVCNQCGTIHYQNPKIIVGSIPIWEGKILLCKRAIEPRKGFWTLPAGFLENKETVEEGAARETNEEANAEIEILRLHTVYSIPHISQVYMFFLAKLVGGEFSASPESEEVKLFLPDEIPWDEIAFGSVTYALKKYIEGSESGEQGTHLGSLRRSPRHH